MFLRLGTINIWPSQSTVSTHMPDSMRSKFPHVRVILDCAEFNAECPDSLVLQLRDSGPHSDDALHLNHMKFNRGLAENFLR